MKKLQTKILLCSGLLLILFSLSGCENGDDNSVNSVDAKIVKELPMMFMLFEGNNTFRVIQSQKELDLLFEQSKLPIKNLDEIKEILKGIDFSRCSLILGNKYLPNLLNFDRDLQYKFRKISNKMYLYEVFYEMTDAETPSSFMHGIVVDKLPQDIEVELKLYDIGHMYKTKIRE